jgi:hypothetical protein
MTGKGKVQKGGNGVAKQGMEYISCIGGVSYALFTLLYGWGKGGGVVTFVPVGWGGGVVNGTK